MQDTTLALAELDRAAKLPGMRAVYMGTNVNGRDLDEPEFFPVFQRCQELGCRWGSTRSTSTGRSACGPTTSPTCSATRTTPASRRPTSSSGACWIGCRSSQVILPHAGGTFPLVWGRLQRRQKVRPEANKAAKKPVKEYLRRFTYDTISHDPGALRYLIDTVGVDRVMLGTDFCFDMGYDRPLDIILDKGVKLSRADQAKVVRGNAARLLRLR